MFNIATIKLAHYILNSIVNYDIWDFLLLRELSWHQYNTSEYISRHIFMQLAPTFTQSALTHWGRVTHICVSKLSILGSDNGLSPGRRQAII